jgi:hypothetical protein
MEHKSGCLVCGGALRYEESNVARRCFYCGAEESTNVACGSDHYVCDHCHSGSANDLIQRYCSTTESTAPMAMAITLMRSPHLKMHGPEHHFLVPAVLLAAYYNRVRAADGIKAKKIAIARRRAEDIKGGFCGFYGNCGAAVGTGIFLSVMTEATPLFRKEWRLSNLMTAESLLAIANHGGPRCCKRDTFLAIRCAVAMLRREFQIDLDIAEPVVWEFSPLNKECTQDACPFCDTSPS